MYYIIISGTSMCKGPFKSRNEAYDYICCNDLPLGSIITKTL